MERERRVDGRGVADEHRRAAERAGGVHDDAAAAVGAVRGPEPGVGEELALEVADRERRERAVLDELRLQHGGVALRAHAEDRGVAAGRAFAVERAGHALSPPAGVAASSTGSQ